MNTTGDKKHIALVAAEVEENLGVRYIMSALENKGHHTRLIPFSQDEHVDTVVKSVIDYSPDIVGLSMVFTLRARGFVNVARKLREAGYTGHITAGGHFASFNADDILQDFSAFDSICHGEGEWIMPELAVNLDQIEKVPDVSYRSNGSIKHSKRSGIQRHLKDYPRPKRSIQGHEYFSKPLFNILSGRGCYGHCTFCSIHTWYNHIGQKHFRQRDIDDVLEEMKECYDTLNARIFNFHDDNFFLPDKQANLERFDRLIDGIKRLKMQDITLSIKARPDNLDKEIVGRLVQLNVFRVFLGIENLANPALKHLGRNLNAAQNLQAIDLLNDADIQTCFNLLIFEPKTTMADLAENLRFMERNMSNPYSFCRTEVYNGTPLERQLRKSGGLLGDYFSWDYVIGDPQVEEFFNIVNALFQERNFRPDGIQNMSMWVDYFHQLAAYFYPQLMDQSLRAAVKNYVKQVNMDNYRRMATIYDFIAKGVFKEPAAMNVFIAREHADILNTDHLLKLQAGEIIEQMEERTGFKATKNYFPN